MKNNLTEKIFKKRDTVSPVRVVNSEQDKLEKIIGGCQNYDPETQEELYKKFYGYVLGVALTYCSTRADADEVVNDSFMKVFKKIKTYKNQLPFKPWLRAIVVNTSIDRARKNKRFNNHVEFEDIQPVSSVDLDAELHAKQIFSLLNELPELLRFVFNMYEIEGYSHREIAGKLEIAESSSRTYLTRAKSELRQLYKTEFMEKSL